MNALTLLREQYPANMIAPLQRLYEQNPTAMVAFLQWIENTQYGSVTLRFSDGVLQVAERTETARK